MLLCVLCFYNISLVSDEELESNEKKVSTWLREHLEGDSSLGYQSDVESSLSYQ